jgi:cholest-4-en-3-one 26-monooxygenase
MAAPTLNSRIDLLDQSLYEAGGPPYELFKHLRAESPVYWNDMPGDVGVWAITRYKDVFDVSLDQKTFSVAALGGHPARDAAGRVRGAEGPPHQHGTARPHEAPPPGERRLRGQGDPQPRADVREVTTAILDEITPLGTCDFVDRVSCELPLQVIVEMVGVPQADRRKVLDWTNTMIAFDDPEYGDGPEKGQMAAAELFMYANELAEDREKNPRGDVVSLLMQAEVDGERLSRADFSAFFMLSSSPATRRRGT